MIKNLHSCPDYFLNMKHGYGNTRIYIKRKEERKNWIEFIIILLIVIVVGIIYFIPTFVVTQKLHKNCKAVIILNVFLGWTFFGWVGALIWAVLESPSPVVIRDQPSAANELVKFAILYEDGVITREEYDAKKKQLLESQCL